MKPTPAVPREFAELSDTDRRKVEGLYNTALRQQEKQNFEEAYNAIRKMHSLVPFFKDSKKLEQYYYKKVKEKIAKAAETKAANDRQAELQMLLEDGLEYLKEGDFNRAEEAFNQAALLDPRNQTAMKGIKAAQARVRDIEQIPPERDPEVEKKKLVADLLGQALTKFQSKSYQESIELAEKVRKIEIRGETEYLNQAK